MATLRTVPGPALRPGDRAAWARSSPLPTTSSARPSGSGWPTATRPTRCWSSCPSPTCAGASTATSGPPPCSPSWIDHHVLVADPAPVALPLPDDRRRTGGPRPGSSAPCGIERRRPAARRDHAQAAQRPARPAAGDRGQPLPHLGPLLTGGLTATFEPKGRPVVEAFDDGGVRHQLWVVDEPGAVAAVTDAVAASPVVVADGHHRYETARNYRRRGARGQRRPAGRPRLDHGPRRRALRRAAHRRPDPPDGRRGCPTAPICGRCSSAGSTSSMPARPPSGSSAALGESRSLALVTADRRLAAEPARRGLRGGRQRPRLQPRRPGPRRPARQQSTHQHTWPEALRRGRATARPQAAVLLRPVTVDQIAEWAAARRRMPPKTTFFSPKPATGMVFRRLDG